MAEAPARPPRLLVVECLAGGTAASGACIVSNPFEVVKTRLQLQGELVGNERTHYRGIWHAFTQIVKHDGIMAVQQGLKPAMGYQFVMNGTRLGLHGPFKRLLGADSPTEKNFFLKSLAAGAASGVLGAGVASPFKMICTRLQTQSSTSVAVGHQHKYRGLLHGASVIFREEGVKGLYRGVTASMMRVTVGSSVQLSTYDKSKQIIRQMSGMRDGPLLHLGASLVSGAAVTIAMNPLDVVSTRLYNQAAGQTKYTGPVDCLKKTVASEGLRGLYKGVIAHYVRLGPHTVLTFLLWEQTQGLATRLGY